MPETIRAEIQDVIMITTNRSVSLKIGYARLW
jgi:hypothetical protein